MEAELCLSTLNVPDCQHLHNVSLSPQTESRDVNSSQLPLTEQSVKITTTTKAYKMKRPGFTISIRHCKIISVLKGSKTEILHHWISPSV